MTAPVQETLEKDRPVTAFTLPPEYALDELPAPDDARVSLVEGPERTMAVVDFSGWATRPKVARMQRKLLPGVSYCLLHDRGAMQVISAPLTFGLAR